MNGVISKTWSHDRNKLIFKQMQQGDGLRQISSLKNKIQKFPTTKKTTQHSTPHSQRNQLVPQARQMQCVLVQVCCGWGKVLPVAKLSQMPGRNGQEGTNRNTNLKMIVLFSILKFWIFNLRRGNESQKTSSHSENPCAQQIACV